MDNRPDLPHGQLRHPAGGIVIVGIGCGRFIRSRLRLGFAMKGLASAGLPAAVELCLDEALAALVHWRLDDPAWRPSFAGLLDDIRTCIDPEAEAVTVLSALRGVVIANPALADRAQQVAIEAGQAMAARSRIARELRHKPAGLRDRFARRDLRDSPYPR